MLDKRIRYISHTVHYTAKLQKGFFPDMDPENISVAILILILASARGQEVRSLLWAYSNYQSII